MIKIKQFIEKKVISLMYYLHRLKAKVHVENLSTDNSGALTARSDKNDVVFDEHLLDALRYDDIQNVAVSGPYSSGKTTKLLSFFKVHPIYKPLFISLAYFEKIESNEKKVKKITKKRVNGNDEPYDENLSLSQAIERSILQQIFYVESDYKMRHSHLLKIRRSKIGSFFNTYFILFMNIISGIMILEPNIFKPVYLNLMNIKYIKYFYYRNYEIVMLLSVIIFLVTSGILLWKFYDRC